MRHERERGGSPLHPVVRVRASRQGQLPEPPSSPSLGSVVAVGRQCLNVLVFLPELLFPARRERRAGAAETKTLSSSHSHEFQINGVYQETLS